MYHHHLLYKYNYKVLFKQTPTDTWHMFYIKANTKGDAVDKLLEDKVNITDYKIVGETETGECYYKFEWRYILFWIVVFAIILWARFHE